MTGHGHERARWHRRVALPVIGLLATASPTAAQDVRVAVIGDSIRVGDVVPVAVRVGLERGQRVAWPDTLPLGDEPDLENAARVRERVDTLPDGRLEATAVYAVTPWRPGEAALPDLPLRLITAGEEARALTASFPALEVVSVLPADTAGIEPRAPKGVIGRNWAWLPILLALLALLALIAALVWWLRRRRGRGAVLPLAPPVPPRERALETLRRARASGLVERREWKPFYSLIGAAVRGYAADQERAWSEDLTTTEVLARIRRQAGPDVARELAAVLRAADQVKFARREPDPETAIREWELAREWVESFAWPPAVPTDAVEEGRAA